MESLSLVVAFGLIGCGLGYGFKLGVGLFEAQSDLNQRLINFIIRKIKKGK